ncbi:hypothetical protein GGP50_001854 [Salinibacter ruber]|uniref:hypothetical protein n=1 Tax=Salinibacter ruber TaxID=146919 RepID=UPI00216763FA|nr:hypothetical protein [Salinibacter ruber]MCS4193632.1 hypothetical protein [Salinibacter ruber]
MKNSSSLFRSPFRRDTETQRSNPPVHTHHVRDLEAALGASIGRNFDVLSRRFRDVQSPSSSRSPTTRVRE